MTRQELVKKAAEEAAVSQKQADAVLNSVISSIMESVAAGDRVQFVGFGTFEARKREARTGFNPRTKEEIEIPASVIPTFKAGKVFKDKVNV